MVRHVAYELTNKIAGNSVIARLNTPSGKSSRAPEGRGLARSTAAERKAQAIADQIPDVKIGGAPDCDAIVNYNRSGLVRDGRADRR